MNDLCHCGKPLHYSDEKIKNKIETLVKKYGRYIDITCIDTTYKVDRHYIALHGIKASQLPFLEFEKEEEK